MQGCTTYCDFPYIYCREWNHNTVSKRNSPAGFSTYNQNLLQMNQNRSVDCPQDVFNLLCELWDVRFLSFVLRYDCMSVGTGFFSLVWLQLIFFWTELDMCLLELRSFCRFLIWCCVSGVYLLGKSFHKLGCWSLAAHMKDVVWVNILHCRGEPRASHLRSAGFGMSRWTQTSVVYVLCGRSYALHLFVGFFTTFILWYQS